MVVRITKGTHTMMWPMDKVATDGLKPMRLNNMSMAKPKARAGNMSGDMKTISSVRAQAALLRPIASALATPAR